MSKDYMQIRYRQPSTPNMHSSIYVCLICTNAVSTSRAMILEMSRNMPDEG